MPQVASEKGDQVLLDGKRLLISGVRDEASLGYAVAELAQEWGAEVVLTAPGRTLESTNDVAARLSAPPRVIELDVTNPEQVAALSDNLRHDWDRVDGVLHSIAFAPPACIGGDVLDAPWKDVATAMNVSAFSLKTIAEAVLPLMNEHGGNIVAIDFDARFVWPRYNWMGVSKAALESVARYLAWGLGRYRIKVNLVAAGPLGTAAAAAVEGHAERMERWPSRAPLGWSATDPRPAAQACVALFADLFPATTGEMIHVDGGYHIMGE